MLASSQFGCMQKTTSRLEKLSQPVLRDQNIFRDDPSNKVQQWKKAQLAARYAIIKAQEEKEAAVRKAREEREAEARRVREAEEAEARRLKELEKQTKRRKMWKKAQRMKPVMRLADGAPRPTDQGNEEEEDEDVDGKTLTLDPVSMLKKAYKDPDTAIGEAFRDPESSVKQAIREPGVAPSDSFLDQEDILY
eukprot:scaffold593838_cov30-Prasinocladus_malaysianus.AAC.1